MQGYHLFEYAVIRLVPQVEREEFLNVGVILFCAHERFLECTFEWDEKRIRALYPEADLELFRKYTGAFRKICQGGEEGGSMGRLNPAERFRWLTATRSTMLQTSPVHPGYTGDPEKSLKRLHEQLVARP